MTRRVKAHIPYFNTGAYPIFFGFTTDEKAFRRELKRLNVKEPVQFLYDGAPATTQRLTRDSDGRGTTIIVTMKPRPKASHIQVLGLLVHEAVHVYQYALQAMRAKEPDEAEFAAYSIQLFAQCMFSEYMKSRKR